MPHRRGLALGAAAAVLGSNLMVDYVFTPVINGGYVSADDSPGFGFLGAGALVTAGVLFALVGVLPHRAPSDTPLPRAHLGVHAASV